MLDWNDLQYILALRDGGTMKQAAILLKTDPTTVSRHIKSISASFGATFFHLDKAGRWDLTPAGKDIVDLAQSVKTKIGRLQNSIGVLEDAKVVKITSLEFLLSHYVAPGMGAEITDFPDTTLNLIGSDKRLSLAYGEADIALRFGRPNEGQLLASKIASIQFGTYAMPNTQPKDWVGMEEESDWLPEMQLGLSIFGRPPVIRVSSYAAAREVAFATGLATIGPPIVMLQSGSLATMMGTTPIEREVWSVIHETRRFSQRLKATRDWLRTTILDGQKKERLQLEFDQGVPDLRQGCAVRANLHG